MKIDEFLRLNNDFTTRADMTSDKEERAKWFDKLGDLWTGQDCPLMGQMWYEAAKECRRNVE